MKQYFKVGELVVIDMHDNENHGKAYEIINISKENYITQDGNFLEGEIGYQLNGDHAVTNWYADDVIKKHHPPSTQTFHEIIEGLKQPVNT